MPSPAVVITSPGRPVKRAKRAVAVQWSAPRTRSTRGRLGTEFEERTIRSELETAAVPLPIHASNSVLESMPVLPRDPIALSESMAPVVHHLPDIPISFPEFYNSHGIVSLEDNLSHSPLENVSESSAFADGSDLPDFEDFSNANSLNRRAAMIASFESDSQRGNRSVIANIMDELSLRGYNSLQMNQNDLNFQSSSFVHGSLLAGSPSMRSDLVAPVRIVNSSERPSTDVIVIDSEVEEDPIISAPNGLANDLRFKTKKRKNGQRLDNSIQDAVEINLIPEIEKEEEEVRQKRKREAELTKEVMTQAEVMANLKRRIICPICTDSIEDVSSTKCGHLFCFQCIKEALQVRKICPCCRKMVSQNDVHRIYF